MTRDGTINGFTTQHRGIIVGFGAGGHYGKGKQTATESANLTLKTELTSGTFGFTLSDDDVGDSFLVEVASRLW